MVGPPSPLKLDQTPELAQFFTVCLGDLPPNVPPPRCFGARTYRRPSCRYAQVLRRVRYETTKANFEHLRAVDGANNVVEIRAGESEAKAFPP